MRSNQKRQRLVQAATELAYHNGFHKMTLAMIAEKAGVPLGNVYYYFNTKEDFGHAIIDELQRQLKEVLESCESANDPRKQLKALVRQLSALRESLSRHGCPFSSLAMELNKEDGDFARRSSAPLATMMQWCETRFVALGKLPREAKDCTLHLIAGVQGACLLAHTLKKPALFQKEANTLVAWLDTV